MAFVSRFNSSCIWSSIFVIDISIISYLKENYYANTNFISNPFAITTNRCSCCWSVHNCRFTNVARFNCACTASSVPINRVAIVSRFDCGCDRVSSDRQTNCWPGTAERSVSSTSSWACSDSRIRVYQSNGANRCSRIRIIPSNAINSKSCYWVWLELPRWTWNSSIRWRIRVIAYYIG